MSVEEFEFWLKNNTELYLVWSDEDISSFREFIGYYDGEPEFSFLDIIDNEEL